MILLCSASLQQTQARHLLSTSALKKERKRLSRVEWKVEESSGCLFGKLRWKVQRYRNSAGRNPHRTIPTHSFVWFFPLFLPSRAPPCSPPDLERRDGSLENGATQRERYSRGYSKKRACPLRRSFKYELMNNSRAMSETCKLL